MGKWVKTIGRRTSARQGFALVITVVLLALLILVLVSTATLTRIETSIGFNSRRQSQAQQNALYALDRAMGELQRLAGPDNRVTALADISLDPPANPLFTGVWPSAVGASVESWLVSGNEYPNDPLDVNESTVIPDPAPDNDSIWLVNTGSVMAQDWSNATEYSPGDRVRRSGVYYVSNLRNSGRQPPNLTYWRPFDPRVKVIKQPLSATIPDGTAAVVGRYAWWVGDEGIKASIAVVNTLDLVNFASPNTDYSDPINQRRLGRLAQREMGRIHAHDPGRSTTYFFTNPTLSDVQKDDMRRLLTRNQFPMVSEALGLSVFRERFHDVTPMSFGVLANTKGGGLKQDLSNPSAFSDFAQPVALRTYLATRPVGSAGLVPIYDVVTVSGGSGGETDPAYSIAPVLVRAVVGLTVLLPATPVGGVPTVQWKADLAFWNPYNARLNIPSLNGFTVKITNPPKLTIDGQIVDWQTTVSAVGGSLGFSIPPSAFPSAVMDPGQTFAISLPIPAQPASNVKKVGGDMSLGASPWAVSMVAEISGGVPLPTKVGIYDNALLLGQFESKILPATTLTPEQDAGDDFYVGVGYELNPTVDGSWLRAIDPRGHIRQVEGATPDPFRSEEGTKTELLASVPTAPAPSFLIPTDPSIRNPFFELPSAENISVGALQHLEFGATVDGYTAAFRLGNADSLGVNAWCDEYFFSGIPVPVPGGGGPDVVWNPESSPLPNGSLFPFNPSGAPVLSGTALITLGANIDDRRPASRLFVRGAFNLNSTSTMAWNSILNGATSPDWQGNTVNDISNVFSRFPHSAEVFDGEVVPAYRPQDPADIRTQGIRFLTPLQREGLAAAIVNRLHLRGRPFGSIEEFLDSGLLDDAIADFDAANGGNDLRINETFSVPVFHPKIPRFAAGYLGQAELYNNWAPFLQARSDTFVIRTYGESRNPVTGAVEARAWCEAVVQRTPDYVNPDETAAWEIPASGSTNEKFGRRFQVIQFRWLSPADI